MTLYDICKEIAQVENGLAYGQIQFCYDNMMCAMKPGHPADILDDIFGDVGNELYLNHDAAIPMPRIKKLRKDLKEFSKDFKISELDSVIRDLDTIIGGEDLKKKRSRPKNKRLEFWVTIHPDYGDGGDVCVEESVTASEYEQLLQCCREDIDLCDCEELENLHNKILADAREESESCGFDDEDLDYDDDACFVSIPDELYDLVESEES